MVSCQPAYEIEINPVGSNPASTVPSPQPSGLDIILGYSAMYPAHLFQKHACPETECVRMLQLTNRSMDREGLIVLVVIATLVSAEDDEGTSLLRAQVLVSS